MLFPATVKSQQAALLGLGAEVWVQSVGHGMQGAPCSMSYAGLSPHVVELTLSQVCEYHPWEK